jgi:NADH-quinone oxidoreductase subunit C
MTDKNLPDRLAAVFKEMPQDVEFKATSARRLKVELRSDALLTLLALLKGNAGYIHLSAISCIDWPELEAFELVYHIWSYEVKTLVSAHIRVPKQPGRFVSVYDLYKPAGFFERDIHEMFGVYFEGSPNLQPFILTEWEGEPPMLKSFNTEAYAIETFKQQDYAPDWLTELQQRGGGVV